MTIKKALIIGTLAVVLTGITACAISYTKRTGKNPLKIQTVETSAYGNVTNYNYTNKDTTISGVINQDATAINIDEGRTLVTSGTYTINKTRNIIGVELSIGTFFNGVDEWEVEPALEQTYLFSTEQQIQRIIITQSTIIYDEEITGYYIYYIVQINNLTPKTYSLTYQNAEYPITETQEEIQLEYSNFTAQINTINNQYETGWTTGNQGTEVVDVRGLMLNVLTMPFTFISQAFNVTLWPGTQYAVNLSNLILGLIAIATILFIIKMFTSGFSIIGNYTGNASNTRLQRQQTKANIAKTKAETTRIEKGTKK